MELDQEGRGKRLRQEQPDSDKGPSEHRLAPGNSAELPCLLGDPWTQRCVGSQMGHKGHVI